MAIQATPLRNPPVLNRSKFCARKGNRSQARQQCKHPESLISRVHLRFKTVRPENSGDPYLRWDIWMLGWQRDTTRPFFDN